MKVEMYDYEEIYDRANGDIDKIIKELTDVKNNVRQKRFDEMCRQLKELVHTMQKEFPGCGAIYGYLNDDYDTEEMDLFEALLSHETSFEL